MIQRPKIYFLQSHASYNGFINKQPLGDSNRQQAPTQPSDTSVDNAYMRHLASLL